jgi:ion channel-forming bestrophin family protein
MIKYNPKSWAKIIFAFHKSDTFQMLRKEILYIGILTLVIAFIVLQLFPDATGLKDLFAVYSLIGFVISLLLVFRTNTAYDRWWEGRKKWGSLVNDTRNFAIKLSSLLPLEKDREFFKRMIPNFAIAAKEHLRKGVQLDQLNLNEAEHEYLSGKEHIPLAISGLLYDQLQFIKQKGQLTSTDVLLMDQNLNQFMECVGACERIKNTPIPFSYSLFIKKFILIYVTTLPLAFVMQFGYFSALIATFVFYILVSMEVLAEEIEDPFGADDNDLPTDQLCETIAKNMEEVLG